MTKSVRVTGRLRSHLKDSLYIMRRSYIGNVSIGRTSWCWLGLGLLVVGCSTTSGQPTRFPRDFDLANGLNHRNKIDGSCATDKIQHLCVFYIEFEPPYGETAPKTRPKYLFSYGERFKVEVQPWNEWCEVSISKGEDLYHYFDLTYSEITWLKTRQWRRLQVAAGATMEVRGTRIRIREAGFAIKEGNEYSVELSKLVFTLSIPLTEEEKKEMADRPTSSFRMEL